jgi:predicted secreted protein
MVPADLPPAIELKAGAELRLAIPSAAGAGYRWELTPLSGREVADVAVEAAPMPPPAGAPSSGAAPLTLVARGRQAGSARWRLELVRPWDRQSPLQTHELVVSVGERD